MILAFGIANELNDRMFRARGSIDILWNIRDISLRGEAVRMPRPLVSGFCLQEGGFSGNSPVEVLSVSGGGPSGRERFRAGPPDTMPVETEPSDGESKGVSIGRSPGWGYA
jgi:hypothetical protein